MKIIFSLFMLFSLSNLFAQELAKDSQEELKAYLEIFKESRSLLKEGEVRIDTSFGYSYNDKSNIFQKNLIKTGQMYSGITYGIKKGFEVYGQFSLGKSYISSTNLLDNNETSKNLSQKSFRLGGKYALTLEDGSIPEVVLNLSYAKNYIESNSTDSIGIGLTLLKSYDPIILIASASTDYNLDTKDSMFSGNFGMAFGINDSIALGSNISYTVPLSTSFKSTKESVSFTQRVTMTTGENIIEPSLTFGLTEDAPDFQFGLSWSRRF